MASTPGLFHIPKSGFKTCKVEKIGTIGELIKCASVEYYWDERTREMERCLSVMAELAEKWDKLTEEQRAAVIAKHRAKHAAQPMPEAKVTSADAYLWPYEPEIAKIVATEDMICDAYPPLPDRTINFREFL